MSVLVEVLCCLDCFCGVNFLHCFDCMVCVTVYAGGVLCRLLLEDLDSNRWGSGKMKDRAL